MGVLIVCAHTIGDNPEKVKPLPGEIFCGGPGSSLAQKMIVEMERVAAVITTTVKKRHVIF